MTKNQTTKIAAPQTDPCTNRSNDPETDQWLADLAREFEAIPERHDRSEVVSQDELDQLDRALDAI